ncbi:MAG: AAA family ATPase [Anaerotignum sp.]
MNKNIVITISRQYGSGGRFIGEQLAKRLDIPFYDNELINLAAEKTGLSKEFFKNAEETSTSNLLFSLTALTPMMDSYGLPLNEKIFLVQSQIVKEVAEKGSCVIVGRCADYILSDMDNCVNVFLQADLSDRVERATKHYGLTDKNIEAAVLKTDKKRASYYSYFTNLKWGKSDNYDLILNTSRMDLEHIVDVIEKYISLR